MFWVLVFCAIAVFSWLVCLGYSRLARFCSVMDFPNERSSHSTPTPRGGGFAFVPLGLLMLSVSMVGTTHTALDILVRTFRSTSIMGHWLRR